MSKTNDSVDFSTIIASSVHDMKNSLAILLGSLSDITSQCQANTCGNLEKLTRIQHEGQRVNHDLIQLLTLYKLDQDQYFLNVEEIDVYDLLDEIIIDYQPFLKEHGISITIQCSEDLTSFFDRDLISGVIKTIINNAYRYAKDSVVLKGERVGEYTQITIEDNGAGYPDNMLQKMSSLPSKSSTNFNTGSTGLGMYFASKVAGLHKNKHKTGYINIENNPINGGGRFSISLP